MKNMKSVPAEERRRPNLEVDPVHAVPDVLEHALVGHEEVAVFEASLTAAGEGRDER